MTAAVLELDEIGLNRNGIGSLLPLPLGEGWSEGLRSLLGPRPLTRFALDDAEPVIGPRFARTRLHRQEQIDLSPAGRGLSSARANRFHQTSSRFRGAFHTFA